MYGKIAILTISTKFDQHLDSAYSLVQSPLCAKGCFREVGTLIKTIPLLIKI